MRFLSPLTREGQGARFRETPRDSRTTPTPLSLSLFLLPRRRRLFFAARDTLAATLAAEKEIARLMSPPKGGMKERETRGREGGKERRERERERERGMLRRSSYNFARVGRSRLQPRFHQPSPPSPLLSVCVLRLNVTIITGKAVHTHAGNRGGTRNYIDISIVSPDGLIN